MKTNFVIPRCGLCLVLLSGFAASAQNPGVLGKIKSGLEYASSYIETAKEIADLVSESLGHRSQKRGDSGDETSAGSSGQKRIFGPQGLAAAFFRLLGLDSPKINAIAVNSAIFLAQMISTAFNLKSKAKQSRGMGLEFEEAKADEEENWAQGPVRLILGSTNERIQDLVRQARDSNLPTHLQERLDGLDTACIRLLVCKASPVIWAAQRSLGNVTGSAKWDVTSWLPSREDFEKNGDECEENHSTCQLFPGA